MVSQKKQVKRLKRDAQRLWADQQALLTRANSVARDAFPHAQTFAQGKIDQVVPSARTVYADKLAPVVGKGAVAGKVAGGYAASTAKDAVTGTLVPAVTSAIAAAFALTEEAGNRIGARASDVAATSKSTSARLGAITKSGQKSAAKANVKLKAAAKAGKLAAKHAPKGSKGLGAGGVIGLVLAVGVLAGIGYAVWQTLRADDDLWVADEDPETAPTSESPTA